VKKQITLAIVLALGSGMVTNQLDCMDDGKMEIDFSKYITEVVPLSKTPCLTAMGAEAISGLAHAYRLGKTMTSKSAKEIKFVSAIAAFTNLATLLAHGYKTTSHTKLKTLSAASDIEAVGRHLFEAFNAIRMYRNAESIADSNKRNPQSFLKAKSILLSSLLANRGLRMAFDANLSDILHLSNKYLPNDDEDSQVVLGAVTGVPLLAIALHNSIYEYGLYDGLKKAQKAPASQDDLGDDNNDEDNDE